MDDPKQMLWNIFCALVRPNTLEHHRHQEKFRCFLPSKLRLFYPMNLVSFFYIRISTKKQPFYFLKRNSYTNVCFKFLCDAKLIFPYRYILELRTFEYGCLVGLNIKDGTRQRHGTLMSNHCLLCHR